MLALAKDCFSNIKFIEFIDKTLWFSAWTNYIYWEGIIKNNIP
jgi:hypothetical protein